MKICFYFYWNVKKPINVLYRVQLLFTCVFFCFDTIPYVLENKIVASLHLWIIFCSSSEDLIHRLYVCISGVADQLQTNFASDLRNILKSVFLMNATDTTNETPVDLQATVEASMEYHPTENQIIQNNEFTVDPNILAQEALFDSNVYFHLSEDNDNASSTTNYCNHPRQTDESLSIYDEELNQQENNLINENNIPSTHNENENDVERAPDWIPDVEAPKCMSCAVNFTVVKRRHHCRNCGKVFCSRCSSNSVPLPKFGHYKPVRVCNKCFPYHLAPFTMWISFDIKTVLK